jgi:hypothetical protein
VSSLIDAVAANTSKAAGADAAAFQPATTRSEHVTIESVAKSAAQSVPKGSGAVVPKFDERTMAALVALQEQHRGG